MTAKEREPETEFVPIHALLTRGRGAGHPVCYDGRCVLSWQPFSARVVAMANALNGRPECRWLLVSDDVQVFAVMLLAALVAGKHVVIPHNSQPGTLEALTGTYDARLDGDVEAGTVETAVAMTSTLLRPIDPKSSVIDLYTSGSTGQPKRIRKTLAQFEAEVAVLEAVWGERLGSAGVVATVPHQHIYGLLFRVFWPLSAGRMFDTVTCAHPDTLVERLALLGDSVLVSSPAQLGRMNALVDLTTLQPVPRMIFSSGGPLPTSAAVEFHRQIGVAPTEVFGSTESGGVAWRQQTGEPDADAWMPFPGIAVCRSERGALCLRSPYLGEAESLEMDDGIEILPDGRFRLLGRLDRVVKIEEKRVSLPDMEFRLNQHPWVDLSSLVLLARRRQSIGAALVLTSGGTEAFATSGRRAVTQVLRDHLVAYFDAVLLPRHWRIVEQLPLDERGKISHAAMTRLFEKREDDVLFPEVLGVTHGADAQNQVVLDLLVAASVSHFEGHFPGLPILPGVVQIDWVVHFARKYLPVAGAFSAMENVKFLALILPDTRLQLSLRWDAASKRLDFSYATDQRTFSAGRVVLGGQA